MACEVYNKQCGPCDIYGQCNQINYDCDRVKVLGIKEGENPQAKIKLTLELVVAE